MHDDADGCEHREGEAAAAGGLGTFAQASFVAQDGTEAMLDMDDPDFWSKVLGEDEGGVVGMDGVDDYGGEFEYDNDGQVAQRRSGGRLLRRRASLRAGS